MEEDEESSMRYRGGQIQERSMPAKKVDSPSEAISDHPGPWQALDEDTGM